MANMRLGGHLDKQSQVLQAWLYSANSGVTAFSTTRWWLSCWEWWVLDVTQTDQRQRIGGGREFLRRAGTVALYRPKLPFEEWQEAGGSAHESWILFGASGGMRDALLALTSGPGYCHFLDPEHLAFGHLRSISETLFHRKAGFERLAQASFLALLALTNTSHPLGPLLRVVKASSPSAEKNGLPEDVEKYIRARIEEPIRVSDLARHAGQGLSTFAHTYSALAGESPYRTIVRLKIAAAKHLLIGEGLSVKETANRLGFSSEFQFSRCFKRMEGLAPAIHVRAMRAKD